MNEIFALPRRRKRDSRRRSTGVKAVSMPLPVRGQSMLPPSADRGALQASMGRSPGAISCELDRLYVSLGQVTPASNTRTFKLFEAGTRKIAQKVIEEAGEVALEAVKHHDRGVVRESADLLYHLVVLWCRAGIEPASVWQELQARASALGIAEKLPKSLGRQTNQDNSNC